MDTRYLRRRGNVWYVDFIIPAGVGGKLAGKRFRLSLETSAYAVARSFRDRYVVPFLREARDRDLLENIAGALARCSRRTETLLEQLFAEAGLKLNLEGAVSSAGTEPVPIRELAEAYLAYLRAATNLAPASIAKYWTTFSALCRILGDDMDAEVIQTEHMVAFRDELLQKPVGWQKRTAGNYAKDDPRTLSPASVSRDLQRIRTWFRWAVNESRLRRRDVPGEGVKCKTVHPRHKERPTVAQADKLLALPCPKERDRLSWEYMPIVGRYTGCRIGEIAGLTAEDVVFDHDIRCLAIRGDRLKTEASTRLVPVADKLAPHLDEVLKLHPKGRLFPNCGDWTSPSGTTKRAHFLLKAWNKAAKLVGPFSFHCWRVYLNDELVRHETDITDRERILGHRSRRTQSAYTSPELARYLKALDQVP